jgi:tRNA(fMet)-specific endonuclease VapC
VEGSDTREKNMQRLHAGLRKIVCWPFDLAAAETYGVLYAALKRQGRLIQQVDLQSAAIALNLGCTMVTKDSDFEIVPGLAVENWAS